MLRIRNFNVTVHPTIAQLAERETVDVEQLKSLGHWFDSGWPDFYKIIKINFGVMGESNPRPPAPKAGIIPLDQSPGSV